MKSNFRLTMLACLVLLPTFAAATDNKIAQQTFVFPDKAGKLHWFTKDANVISAVKTTKVMLEKKLQKDALKAPLPLEEVKAGGMGGNEVTGFVYYDDGVGPNHFPSLNIKRNPLTKTCYLQNDDVTVRDWAQDLDVSSFPCDQPDPEHNNLYWKNSFDVTNGAYNPALDAFAIASAASKMYQNQFSLPVWSQWGKGKVPVLVFIHARQTYFDMGGMFNDGTYPWEVSIADGDDKSYPWTTIEMFSNLVAQGTALSTWGFSWGLGNGPSIAQSYCDLFSKAVEFSMTGNVTWSLGETTFRGWGYRNIRYMDNPTKTCQKDINTPGADCPIDTYAEYKAHSLLLSEYGAGLLDKVFYLIATAPGWDVKQVYQLVNHATYYWGNPDFDWDSNHFPEDHLNFHDVFCSLLTSASDYKFDQAHTAAITNALTQVGFDSTTCTAKLG